MAEHVWNGGERQPIEGVWSLGRADPVEPLELI